MSLVQRLINVQFVKASGTFSEAVPPANTLTLSGLRTSAKIRYAGGNTKGTMQLAVYGMTPGTMNDLSTLGMQVQLVPRNMVTVLAGDAVNGMATVFQGTCTNVFADYNASPDVCLRVEATVGLDLSVSASKSASFPNGLDVSTVLQGIASNLGLGFQNYGVTAKLPPSYFWGSPLDQIGSIVKAANIQSVIDVTQTIPTLVIWPKGQGRGGQVALISPDSGLVGYPSWCAFGLSLKTLFNPAIGYGSTVEVQSSLPQASGNWIVYGIDLDLESMVYNGNWFMTLDPCVRPGTDIPAAL